MQALAGSKGANSVVDVDVDGDEGGGKEKDEGEEEENSEEDVDDAEKGGESGDGRGEKVSYNVG